MQNPNSEREPNGLAISARAGGAARHCMLSAWVDSIPLCSPDAVRAKASEAR